MMIANIMTRLDEARVKRDAIVSVREAAQADRSIAHSAVAAVERRYLEAGLEAKAANEDLAAINLALTEGEGPSPKAYQSAQVAAEMAAAKAAALRTKHLPEARQMLETAEEDVSAADLTLKYWDLAISNLERAIELGDFLTALKGHFRRQLRLCAEAELETDAVNATLPKALIALQTPEEILRDRPREEEELISEEVVECWVYDTTGARIPDDKIVRPKSDREGVVYSGGMIEMASPVHLAKFKKITKRPGRARLAASRLSSSVLPSVFAGELPIWPGQERMRPSWVLEELADLEAGPDGDKERRLIVIFEPVRES